MIAGMGLPSAVFLALLVLKLMGYITISWLWVFAPLFIGYALVGVMLVFILIIAVVAALVE